MRCDELQPASYVLLPKDGPQNRPGLHSTGPKTPEGKERSSRNATKHGCTSRELLLDGEDRDEWEQLRQGWFDDYDPGTHTSRRLVLQLAEADWFLLRNVRQYRAVEHELHETEPLEWTEEQHRKRERFLRYKTTAERAFDRALARLEQVRKTRMADGEKRQRAKERQAVLELRMKEHELRLAMAEQKRQERAAAEERKAQEAAEKRAEREAKERERDAAREVKPGAKTRAESTAQPKTKAEELFQGQDHPKKLGKVQILDQWVEIRVKDGKTTTTLFPPNEELIKEGKKMLPPPTLVYRRMNFVDGVPEEYRWAATEDKWELGGCGIQRMTVDTWLDVIEKEKQSGSDLLMAVPNLPRPKERGGCECDACRFNEERLEGEREKVE